MLNWLHKSKIVKTEVISLSPVTLSGLKICSDGGVTFIVTRGQTKESVRMYGGDKFELNREISINLVER